MDRGLFRGRFLAGHLAVLAVAVLFVRLGFWQLERLDDVRGRNALIEQGLRQPAAPLHEVLSAEGAPERGLYRRVTATGRFDPDVQIVVTFRTLEGRPGHYLVGALDIGRGHSILVNRGWVPLSEASTRRPAQAAAAYPLPVGDVRVSGLLMPSETGAAPSGEGVLETGRIDVGALGSALALPLSPLYLQLAEEDPAATPGPTAVPPPEFDEGPHLSYAIQWFLFTAIGVVGWAFVLRRSLGSWRDRDGRPRRLSPPRRCGPDPSP